MDVLIDNIVFEYRRQRQHRTLRQDVTVWTAYYRKNRAERCRQSLPFDRLLAVYVGLFQTLVAEIAPVRRGCRSNAIASRELNGSCRNYERLRDL